MPWKESTRMSERLEFVQLALTGELPFATLCRRFGISRKTGYKWLHRYRHGGPEALHDRLRRPHTSPQRTPAEIEQALLALHRRHPRWGPRKLHHALRATGHPAPAPSTIATILRRHGLPQPTTELHHPSPPGQRFEHPAPNHLWQMDFKGPFRCLDGQLCHPLTVLDDHSRYNLCLQACPNERRPTVQQALTATFRRYGLPAALLTDNGPPWGNARRPGLTRLGLWLIRLGIRLHHSRPHHPQTLGKGERYHRTLATEALHGRTLLSLAHCQRHFDRFRHLYNHHRPHQALGFQTPASRYRPSPRPFPETLPPITYPEADLVRRVQAGGWISFHGRPYRLPKVLVGHPVALRPHPHRDGLWRVYFCHQLITTLDERQPGNP